MGVNHSTVSRKIEKLEKELAIKLFERRNSGYALTVHGKDLYKEVQKIDFKISALKERFIPNPDLMDGKLVIYKQGEGSIATLLGELNMHVYGSKEYLKKVKNVDDFEWVTYKRKDQADTNFVVNAFFQNPNIIISSNSYQDAHAFVSSGNGVTFLTDLDGDNDPRLVPFNKEEYSFKIGFYLIQHELSRSNPIVRAVKQTILENIEELLQGTNFVTASNLKKN
ncbi:MAG: LysR family transcriptional regulator [Proteobacteria bacterium]|nr:LysR family transcriptional regulator [Pseudomonadota bacterium]